MNNLKIIDKNLKCTSDLAKNYAGCKFAQNETCNWQAQSESVNMLTDCAVGAR